MKIKELIFNKICLIFPTLFLGMIPALLTAEAPPALYSSPTFTLNLVERVRLTRWDNAVMLDSGAKGDTAFTRTLTSLAGRWKPSEKFEFLLKVTNEFRYYIKPDNRDFTFNEIFIDNLYARWNRPSGLPFTLTLGRQNLILGEGFVVMDGHPLDGSRSIYFNAARVDAHLDQKGNHTLTFFYMDQTETDDQLPLLNEQDQPLIEQPERGLGAYYSGTLANGKLEGYLIQKWVDEGKPDTLSSDFSTLGLRWIHPLSSSLSWTTETAAQFGSLGEQDRKAYGGYSTLMWDTGRKGIRPSRLSLGLIYLSGDDPATADWEGWDPIFSRWPKWSESYIYTFIREYNGRVAYWSNFASLYGSLTFSLTPRARLDFTYHHLRAPQDAPPDQAFPGGSGHTRGDLFITKLNLTFSRNLTGHLLWERFSPGNYYFQDADGYDWFRFECLLKF
ncbi:MAG TPA: hypothetical protein PK014_02995 [Thermoanaerobaculia bacterium]|nr:hypothetical protein [Thermoanaerobaculia bacterium]HUM29024.1 hypothetical protein [Thermoanaerobaculia bacterium]HXK67420.1 hypothetical protein [Thermoanaerobaculia bacterium]